MEELDQRAIEIFDANAADHMAEQIVAAFVQGVTFCPEVLERARETGVYYSLCAAVRNLPALTSEAPTMAQEIVLTEN